MVSWEKMTGKAILKKWPPANFDYVAADGKPHHDPASYINGREKYHAGGDANGGAMQKFYTDSRPLFAMRPKAKADE